MWLYVAGLILSGNYIVLNKNIQEGSKVGFFIVALVLFLLILTF